MLQKPMMMEVKPSAGGTRTAVRILGSLPGVPDPRQLGTLLLLLTTWNCQPVRIAISVENPGAWLTAWLDVLGSVVPDVADVEVEFIFGGADDLVQP